GDTRHCVNGKEFGDLTTAPPCVPKWPGGNNGGATYQGVTADKIEIVYYREKDNPVVAQIEKQIGVYSDPNDQEAYSKAAEKFINSRYDFYGRKVHIDMYRSASCDTAPPKGDCFRNDVRALNDQFHPFGVIYENNSNVPEFHDEATRLGIVSLGGWHFSDQVFNIPHRPFHYDVYMGGDSQAEITGEYWCKRLANKPAKFAGDEPGSTLRTKVRKVAIITQDTPVNKPSGQHLADVIHKCDPNFDMRDFIQYSPDISTATQQANTQVAQLKADNVTSVLFFGDPIAPLYFTKACSSQQWYPEHVLVGSGLIDYDVLGRLYDSEQWKHAFGPSDIPTPLPLDKSDAAIVWHAAGNPGPIYSAANLPWSYFNTMANGLELAGPHLDPGTLERGALTAPPLNDYRQTHDQYHALTVFRPGKYTAITDQREVYWDANATSLVDGQKGAYVPLNNGARYAPGTWPSGEPTLPPGV
ncbi:MAG: hypothetical protein QOK05_893, partial [Chloroflexota bacterium]|nr:hypothetical protein [Chloroflexota bacterium]